MRDAAVVEAGICAAEKGSLMRLAMFRCAHCGACVTDPDDHDCKEKLMESLTVMKQRCNDLRTLPTAELTGNDILVLVDYITALEKRVMEYPSNVSGDMIEAWEKRCRALVKVVGESATCAAPECRREIYFVVTKAGKRAPYDADGQSHFATCSAPERFRKEA